MNPDAVIWMGMPDSLETLMQKYDVDEALYAEGDALQKRLSQASVVYTIPITDTSSFLDIKWAGDEDRKKLYRAFCEARAVKDDWEIELIKKANQISSDAHIKVYCYSIYL